jgi:uncharacterized membrane protein YkoI
MKINKIIVGFSSALFAFSVYAADVPQHAMPMSNIINKLTEHGYVVVNKIDYDNNVFHVEGIDKQGKEVKSDVDPASGKITDTSTDKAKLTLSQAVKKAEQAGYKNIYSIEASGDKFEVKALDKDGKEASVDVDAVSGEVKQ